MKTQVKIKGNTYTAAKFNWTVDGNAVLLTKDDGRSIISVNLFTYKSNDRAHDAAWRLASLQARA